MAGDLPIKELGPKGDGIHDSARGRIYVDRALPGDSVQAKIRRGDDGVMRGDLVEITKASPHRVQAPCVHYDDCGGCTLQHAHVDFYKDWKQESVRDTLAKKGLRPATWLEPVFLSAGNRRRATFAAFKKNNVVTMGYYKRRSHQISDITACLVVDPAILSLRKNLAILLAPIMSEKAPVDVFIQKTGAAFDIVMTGAIGRNGKPDLQVREALAHILKTANLARISWRARERDNPEIMVEREAPRVKFGELSVALPPMAFLQPTKEGETALVNAVLAALESDPTKKLKFADLFSGCGTFSGPMLELGSVDAYESVDTAVRALDKAKGATQLKVFRRDLFRNPLRREEANKYDAIVFDPPRAGAKEQMEALASSRVKTLVGVSCNPATFARDARALVDGGYKFETCQVVDQFTWSHHVELVAKFTKN